MTKHLGFIIEGEFITDFVRSRVLEGAWDYSWSLLMEHLHGMTADTALRILKGEARLVGENSVKLEDDDDQEYKRKLAWKYGGTWRTSDGRCWQPYAIVTSWGPEDHQANNDNKVGPTPHSDHAISDRLSDKGKDYAGRSIFYADDPRNDVLKFIDVRKLGMDTDAPGPHSVLFKEIRGYPTMLMSLATQDAEKAFEQFLQSGRYIRELGYSQLFPAETFGHREETKIDEEPKFVTKTDVIIEKPETPAQMEAAVRQGKEIKAKKARETAVKVKDDLEGVSAVVTNPDADISERLNAYNRMEEAQKRAQERLGQYRIMIIEQAGEDYVEVPVGNRIAVVPRAPLEQWSLRRTRGAHLALPWKTVTPSGMKMMNDDPYHSDFLIGGYWKQPGQRAWLDYEDWYRNDELISAFYGEQSRIQKSLLNFSAAVLCGTGVVDCAHVQHLKPGDRLEKGKVGIIRNAGPGYIQAAEDVIQYGTALITENGGAMAHLANVGRERNLRLLRVPKAREVYPEGVRLTVDCDNGQITIWQGVGKDYC